MSVFGGDSWAREAQYRKRRIDELMVENVDASAYKKLSSGKFSCLVCPHRPILDTPLMLSVHTKGSRHRAAESRLRERELGRQDEIKKRVALSDESGTATTSQLCRNGAAESRLMERELGRQDEVIKRVALSESGTATTSQLCRSASKPLIERTKKAASDILCQNLEPSMAFQVHDIKFNKGDSTSGVTNERNSRSVHVEVKTNQTVIPQAYSRVRQERELRFTSAGWKRDGYGRWFKDENVEFDSDEEDPNICLP